ncbi:MAG: hypothetical protein CMK62_07780 [Pseudoalteromonadaceae bacterium]|nr:hypothetical protein [Pseudoalteromonadaceae bacterium]OUX89183.1 MAG: hypothetical protein CBC03_07930 [Pseudoalteromonas sp. TMED43]
MLNQVIYFEAKKLVYSQVLPLKIIKYYCAQVLNIRGEFYTKIAVKNSEVFFAPTESATGTQ